MRCQVADMKNIYVSLLLLPLTQMVLIDDLCWNSAGLPKHYLPILNDMILNSLQDALGKCD